MALLYHPWFTSFHRDIVLFSYIHVSYTNEAELFLLSVFTFVCLYITDVLIIGYFKQPNTICNRKWRPFTNLLWCGLFRSDFFRFSQENGCTDFDSTCISFSYQGLGYWVLGPGIQTCVMSWRWISGGMGEWSVNGGGSEATSPTGMVLARELRFHKTYVPLPINSTYSFFLIRLLDYFNKS